MIIFIKIYGIIKVHIKESILKLILLLVLSFSFSAFSIPTAVVEKVVGTVMFKGEKLTVGSKLTTDGILFTKKKSYVKIHIPHWGNSIVLGSSSKMKLSLSSKKTKRQYSFIKGICRWKTIAGLKTGPKDKKGQIFTRNAVLGVRGTDFLLKAGDLLGETEVVVFDGQVELQNTKNAKDKALINKGQWGGLGGRYGNTVGEIINLPKKALNYFNKQLKN